MASVVSRESYFETGLDMLSDLDYGRFKPADVCNRRAVARRAGLRPLASVPDGD